MITVGSLTNVPAPGDPVQSPWAQDVSARVIHQFASLSALKAALPTAPTGMFAYLLDEDSMVVGKAGTWRWYHKMFPHVTGSTAYLTIGTAMNTIQSSLAVHGRQLTLWINAGLTTPATSGSLNTFTLAAGYRPTVRADTPAGMGSAAGAGSGRIAVDTPGGATTIFAAASNPSTVTNVYATIQYEVADLVLA